MNIEWGTPISREKIVDRRNKLIEFQKTNQVRYTPLYQIIDENILAINYMIYEIKRLNNIINELEKWLESEIDRIIKLKSPKRRSIPPYGEENCYYENMILRYKEVLDKLKELKGSDKE